MAASMEAMMASPTKFANEYFTQVSNLISAFKELRSLNDRIEQDGELIADYFLDNNHRTDIDAQDFDNAKGAVQQLLFAFDSGAPTQKSFLFNLL